MFVNVFILSVYNMSSVKKLYASSCNKSARQNLIDKIIINIKSPFSLITNQKIIIKN